jgi:hypothetical protein
MEELCPVLGTILAVEFRSHDVAVLFYECNNNNNEAVPYPVFGLVGEKKGLQTLPFRL